MQEVSINSQPFNICMKINQHFRMGRGFNFFVFFLAGSLAVQSCAMLYTSGSIVLISKELQSWPPGVPREQEIPAISKAASNIPLNHAQPPPATTSLTDELQGREASALALLQAGVSDWCVLRHEEGKYRGGASPHTPKSPPLETAIPIPQPRTDRERPAAGRAQTSLHTP